jgi:hypothetical protein
MSARVQLVYDDREHVPEAIARIVGARRFGSILRNRTPLAETVANAARAAGVDEITAINDAAGLESLRARLRAGPRDTCFVHVRARGAIADADALALVLRKVALADGMLFDRAVDPLLAACHGAGAYESYLDLATAGLGIGAQDFDPPAQLVLPDDALVDLTDLPTFVAYFAGGFEARHFNLVSGDDVTVVKRSADRAKIEAEYRYLTGLPEALRRWFVQPYDLRLDNGVASYRMERLGVADVALIWIHGAMDAGAFAPFLDKLFRYIDERPQRALDRDQYMACARTLYVDKVKERIARLAGEPDFAALDAHIRAGTPYEGLRAAVDDYLARFEAYLAGRGNRDEPRAVIGHGDLCLSNILYDKATRLMKFVDPRGAGDGDGMWIDPYYDLAKLSHSIFGAYDFLNNDLFTIEVSDALGLELTVQAPALDAQQAQFQHALEARGYDLYGIRLREASLFLSMLPLHLDSPRKVLAFALDGIAILRELGRND